MVTARAVNEHVGGGANRGSKATACGNHECDTECELVHAKGARGAQCNGAEQCCGCRVADEFGDEGCDNAHDGKCNVGVTPAHAQNAVCDF